MEKNKQKRATPRTKTRGSAGRAGSSREASSRPSTKAVRGSSASTSTSRAARAASARKKSSRTHGSQQVGPQRSASRSLTSRPAKNSASPSRKRTAASRRDTARARNAVNESRRRKPKSRFPFKPVIAIVAIALVVALLRLAFCSPEVVEDIMSAPRKASITTEIRDTELIDDSPYDWSHIQVDPTTGFYSYVEDGKVKSRLGVDISEHNALIDWTKVKAAGVDFAYIRLGYRGTVEGNIVSDSRFASNFSSARTAGLDVGVYFFSQAINEDEAREEARYVIKTLNGASVTYPIAFDFEPALNGTDRISDLSQDQMTAIARAFCSEIESNGYEATVYGNQYDLRSFDLTQLATYGFWYAEYDSHPTGQMRFGIWQYTSKGSVPGIDGIVDVDLDLTPVLHAQQDSEASSQETSSDAEKNVASQGPTQ